MQISQKRQNKTDQFYGFYLKIFLGDLWTGQTYPRELI